MSLSTTLWGKSFWLFLHYTSLTYPIYPNDREKNDFKNIIDALTRLLPCTQCKNHIIEILKYHHLTDEILSIKLKLIVWVYDLHNTINVLTGKPILSFEDAMLNLFIQCKFSDAKNDNHVESEHIHDDEIDNITIDYVLTEYDKCKKNKSSRYIVTFDEIYCEYQKDIDEIAQIAKNDENGDKIFIKTHSEKYLTEIKIIQEEYKKKYLTMYQNMTTSHMSEIIIPKQKSIDIKLLITKFVNFIEQEPNIICKINIVTGLRIILQCL